MGGSQHRLRIPQPRAVPAPGARCCTGGGTGEWGLPGGGGRVTPMGGSKHGTPSPCCPGPRYHPPVPGGGPGGGGVRARCPPPRCHRGHRARSRGVRGLLVWPGSGVVKITLGWHRWGGGSTGTGCPPRCPHNPIGVTVTPRGGTEGPVPGAPGSPPKVSEGRRGPGGGQGMSPMRRGRGHGDTGTARPSPGILGCRGDTGGPVPGRGGGTR